MITKYAIDMSIVIVVVVTCADRAYRQFRIVSCDQGLCILCPRAHGYRKYINISQHTLSRTLLHGTPFNLVLLRSWGGSSRYFRKPPEPLRFPPSYRWSLPSEILPSAPFNPFTSVLSPNNGYFQSPLLMSVDIFLPLPRYMVSSPHG